jgi:prevent-host-death family protein
MIKTTSVSALKARLSAFLEIVRRGDEVLVTDRGRPVARLAPVSATQSVDGRRDELIRTGRLRAPKAKLPKDFWDRKRPADPKGKGLAALLAERESGW